MNNDELDNLIESHESGTEALRPDFRIYDDILDLGKGFYAVSLNEKWGCLDYKGDLITYILYDFVTLDEYQYGMFCLICGHEGMYYIYVRVGWFLQY